MTRTVQILNQIYSYLGKEIQLGDYKFYIPPDLSFTLFGLPRQIEIVFKEGAYPTVSGTKYFVPFTKQIHSLKIKEDLLTLVLEDRIKEIDLSKEDF